MTSTQRHTGTKPTNQPSQKQITPEEPPPQIGDLVEDAAGRQQVVSDHSGRQYVLRPMHSASKETSVDTAEGLTVLARRGTWGGYPDGLGLP